MARPKRPDPRRVNAVAEAFPARLRDARERRELTLEAVAELLGVARQTVYAWEHGLSLPSFRQLMAVCETFDWPFPGR